jgi:hypothetical protein
METKNNITVKVFSYIEWLGLELLMISLIGASSIM